MKFMNCVKREEDCFLKNVKNKTPVERKGFTGVLLYRQTTIFFRIYDEPKSIFNMIRKI